MVEYKQCFMMKSAGRSLVRGFILGFLAVAASWLAPSHAAVPGLTPAPTPGYTPAPGTSPFPGTTPAPGSCLANPSPGGNTRSCSGLASKSTSQTGTGAGNPINLTNGNKYQQDEDLAALPGILGNELVRHYNSAYSTSKDAPGLAGRGWRFGFETQILFVGATLQVMQADGARIIFNRDKVNPNLCSTQDPQDGRMEVVGSGTAARYVWTWPGPGKDGGRRLEFNAKGKLTLIREPSGESMGIHYDSKGRLADVVDAQGRTLTFHYLSADDDARGRRFRGVQAVDTPVGRYSYTYADRQIPNTGALPETLANLTKVTFPDGSERHYHYEDAAHPLLLTGVSVASEGQAPQRLRTWSYDSQGLATRSAKAARGDDVAVASMTTGLKGETRITDDRGQATTFTHENIAGHPRLTRSQGAGCEGCPPAQRRWSYDELGRLKEVTELDEQGQALRGTKYERDALGRVQRELAVEYAQGKPQRTTLRYRAEYEETGSSVAERPVLLVRPSVVPGQERKLRVAYNAAGQPTAITETGLDPTRAGVNLERTTRYAYRDVEGRSLLVQVDGPLPNGPQATPADSDITRYEWDAQGRHVERIIHPGGGTTRFDYDARTGRVARSVGVDGVATTLDYNFRGQVTQVARGGRTHRLAYDAAGRRTAIRMVDGQGLNFAYDGADRIAAITDIANHRIDLTRDEQGALTQARLLNPDGSVEAEKRFEAIGAGSGSAGPQKQDAVMAAIMRTISLAQDEAGNLARPELRVDWGSAQAMQRFLTRDASGKSSAQDVDGRVTDYWMDDFGQLVLVQSPTTGESRFRWDLAGRVVERTQADGARALYTRDMAGRVVAVKALSAQGHLDEDAHIEWGAANKPVRIGYKEGEERFSYDPSGRLIGHEQRVDGQRFQIRYAYDEKGQLLTKTLPDGQVLAYRWRGAVHPYAGLLESIWLKGVNPEATAGSAVDRITGGRLDRPIIVGLNEVGERFKLRQYTLGNGLVQQVMRDDLGRIVGAGNAQAGKTQLRYEGQAQTEPVEVDTSHAVRLGQTAVADARLPDDWLQRLRARSMELQASAPQAQAQALQQAGLQPELAPQYDALGRQISYRGSALRYDSLNRLIEVKRKAGDGGAEGLTARYRYNLFGQRIAKAVSRAQGGTDVKTTYYFYDGSQLVAERGGDKEGGQVPGARQYIWLNETPVAMLEVGHSIAFVHTDHRAAPLALSDEQGKIVWQATVKDYLLVEGVDASSGTPSASAPLGIEFNLRGSNQYFDAETGLHYNTNRYFDPIAARYLTPDPIGLAVGPDLYAFALGEPHTVGDPLGLAPISNADGSLRGWTSDDKFLEIINRTIPLVPAAIGDALRELTAPGTLATIAAGVAIFAAVGTIPVIGWIADAALVGAAAWAIGSGIVDLYKAFDRAGKDANTAYCSKDLDDAASRLARSFVTSGGELVGGLAGVWGSAAGGGVQRAADGIRALRNILRSRAGSGGSVVAQGTTGAVGSLAPLAEGLGNTIPKSSISGFEWTTDPRLFLRRMGDPWEEKVQALLGAGWTRTAGPFKVWDHWNATLGKAISTKTLNTITDARLRNPAQITSTLRGYINSMVNFVEDEKAGLRITSAMIREKEMQLAIPAGTTSEQWAAINSAVEYARSVGIRIVITVIAP